MNVKIHILFLFSALTASLMAQTAKDTLKEKDTQIRIINGDTALYVKMPDLNIFSNPAPVFKSASDEWKYWRLVRNIKKVYPYAKIAKAKIEDLNAHFLTLKTEREKKAYTKQVEKELRAQFEEQLKDLTTTQGALLIKLIDREIGQSSYDLVKELRGGLTAVLGQTMARLFGLNLKSRYDKDGADKGIEEIIQAIDAGIY
jgi:hypothetical protein